MPYKAKKKYIHAKYQRADERIYKLNWDFIVIFWILGLSYPEASRQQFTIGTKNSLSWIFSFVANAKIHFGKYSLILFFHKVQNK